MGWSFFGLISYPYWSAKEDSQVCRRRCTRAEAPAGVCPERSRRMRNPLQGLQPRGRIERLEPLAWAGTTAGAVAPARNVSAARSAGSARRRNAESLRKKSRSAIAHKLKLYGTAPCVFAALREK